MSRYKQTLKEKEKTSNKGDYNDCSVIAVAIATGVGYSLARNALALSGRKFQKGSSIFQIMEAVKRLGFKAEHNYVSCTVGSIGKNVDMQGNNIAITCNHALAVVNNSVEDHSAGSRRRIKSVLTISGGDIIKPNDVKKTKTKDEMKVIKSEVMKLAWVLAREYAEGTSSTARDCISFAMSEAWDKVKSDHGMV